MRIPHLILPASLLVAGLPASAADPETSGDTVRDSGAGPVRQASAEVDPINFGWHFARGAHPEAAEPGFDDSGWNTVDLPHDRAIGGPFNPQCNPDTAMLQSLGSTDPAEFRTPRTSCQYA